MPDGACGRSVAERQLWNCGSGLRGWLRLSRQFHVRVQEILRKTAAQHDLLGTNAVFSKHLIEQRRGAAERRNSLFALSIDFATNANRYISIEIRQN